jgi:hypothetical protein
VGRQALTIAASGHRAVAQDLREWQSLILTQDFLVSQSTARAVDGQLNLISIYGSASAYAVGTPPGVLPWRLISITPAPEIEVTTATKTLTL